MSKLASVLSTTLTISSAYIYDNWGASNLVYQGSRALTVLDYMYSDLEEAPYLEYKHKKYLDYRNKLMGPRVKKALAKI